MSTSIQPMQQPRLNLGLFNPDEMGSGIYGVYTKDNETVKENKLKRSKTNYNLPIKKIRESYTPTHDLDNDTIQNPEYTIVHNLNDMKDKKTMRKYIPESGVYFDNALNSEAGTHRVREIQNQHHPPFQRRKGEELDNFIRDYDPENVDSNEVEKHKAIWFGGRTRNKRPRKINRKTKRKTRRKNKRKTRRKNAGSGKRTQKTRAQTMYGVSNKTKNTLPRFSNTAYNYAMRKMEEGDRRIEYPPTPTDRVHTNK